MFTKCLEKSLSSPCSQKDTQYTWRSVLAVVAPVHVPIPRYTVEWHGDYQSPDMVDRSHHYQHHPQSTLASTSSGVRLVESVGSVNRSYHSSVKSAHKSHPPSVRSVGGSYHSSVRSRFN